jgi:hypothetical protein
MILDIQPIIFFGTLLSLLMSVVVYFVKQLHSDFKKVEQDLMEVKTTTALIKSEFRSSQELIKQRVDYLENRMEKVETIILKKIQDEIS